MNRNLLAAQLFTVRDHTKTVEGFADAIARVKAIGYTAAQVSSIGPFPPAEVKKICDDHGITIVNTHIALAAFAGGDLCGHRRASPLAVPACGGG